MSEKNRLRVNSQANHLLMLMKNRTGLTPNILSRIGFCYSLKNYNFSNPDEYLSDGEETREFNRYTLFGGDNFIYMALQKQWLLNISDDQNIKFEKLSFDQITESHLNRGILLLSKKIRGIEDIAKILK